jgi:hypothetical protein
LELVINRGAADGVQVGMRFEVLAEAPLSVVDPESKQSLGQIDRAKVNVEAREVHERFSICATFETKTIGGALSLEVVDLFQSRRTVPVTLKAEDASLPPPLPEEDSYVRIGDRVRELAIPAAMEPLKAVS